MTTRLYYAEPYLQQFDATVTRVEPHESGFAVELDQTAFYPTGGGQPCDWGTIDGHRVLDCVEDESAGGIVHILEGGPVAGVVRGVVDWQRRIDHMQQHSGQHLLSQAIIRVGNWPTIGFHLGQESSTIDLAGDGVTREAIAQAEDLANRIVIEDRPVSVLQLDAAKASEAGLRKLSDREGELRIIDIEDFDRSGCCGTHVTRTGEIGPVLITGHERVRKTLRVSFLCGFRAIRHARRLHDVCSGIARTMSRPIYDLDDAVAAMALDLEASRKRIAVLQEQLLGIEGASFPAEDGIAACVLPGRLPEELRILAHRIAERPGTAALLLTGPPEIRLFASRAADRPEDMSQIVRKVVEKFGGKGGGRPQMAQCGGMSGASEAILEFAKAVLVSARGS